MARLLIADDHDVVICGLRQVIRAQDRWEIVAEAGNERQALAGVMDLKPDVAVIAHSSRISASRVTRIIRANVPRTEVLVFAAHHSEPVMQDSYRRQSLCPLPGISTQFIDATCAPRSNRHYAQDFKSGRRL